MSDAREPGSFRDPSGYLFTANGVLYRHVAHVYREDYDRLMSSGLYTHLVEAQHLIPHEEVACAQGPHANAYRLLRPERLPFISYPYEWCFGQLQQAALLTLQIQKAALHHDMILKDASAYNIQFRHGRPIFIDTLSFTTYTPDTPWAAYRQFCQHFLAPLALMAFTDVQLNRLLATYLDGIPLPLASRLLHWRTWLSLALVSHLHLHAYYQQRYHDSSAPRPARGQRISRQRLLNLMDHLDATVRNLRFKGAATEWGDYYDDTNYSSAAFQAKQQQVAAWLEQLRPDMVWDMGANRGDFSRLAAQQGIQTIAIDGDPLAVEKNHQQCVHDQERRILPLLLDLTNPSPALGWHHRERQSLVERGPADVVLALALIHHLTISNNVPLVILARFFEAVGRVLIIEFVPKTDSQVQRLLRSRQDVFPDYEQEAFEHAFRQHFVIEAQATVKDSQRVLYLMRRKAL